MEYVPIRLQQDIVIDQIVSVHYYEYTKDFVFEGEQHDFWEFVYVDKGEIIAVAGNKKITVKSGNILFRKPNLWHTDIANGKVAPNVVIVSFLCKSPQMKALEDALLTVGSFEKQLLSKLIAEAKAVFSNPLGNPYTKKLCRREHIPFGAQQLILLYLQELLIRLIRQTAFKPAQMPAFFSVNEAGTSELFKEVDSYLKRNLSKKISLQDLAKLFNISASSIKVLFQKNANMGFKPYFITMKMECAKTYLREGNYNVTQISQLLGFENIHYFSRIFKKYVGMTPTEYAKSVKVWIEDLHST